MTQLVKKLPAYYEARKFINVFTRALHWAASRTRWTQSITYHPISLRYILILSSHLWPCLPSGLFPSRFPTKILYAFLVSLIHAAYSAYFILLDLTTLIIFYEAHKLWISSLCSLFQPPPPVLAGSSAACSQTPSIYKRPSFTAIQNKM